MCTYDAKVIFKLLNFHDPAVHTQHPCTNSEVKHTEEAEEPEPEHKQRTMMVLKFTEGLGLIEADIEEFKDIDWNKQGAATTRRNYDDVCLLLGDSEGGEAFVLLCFFGLSSGACASPPLLEMIQMTCLEFCKKCLSLNCHLFFMFNTFCTFFIGRNIYFLLSQSRLFGTTLPILM